MENRPRGNRKMPEENREADFKKSQKKTNLLDHNSIKHTLDESVAEIVASKRYPEDVRINNVRLLIGMIVIVVGLFAQFYDQKFPDNRNFLIGCIVLYVFLNVILQLIIYVKQKNAILVTYGPPKPSTGTGLVVTSKLPKFSDMYTLTIASAEPRSISAKPTSQFTKSVTKWFTKDGVLVERLFWNDVGRLINDYAKGGKKKRK